MVEQFVGHIFGSRIVFFKKKLAILGLFFVYFRSFQTNNTILTTNQCEKMSCPSSIRHWDSNPRPLECESPPITTRPGLPPKDQELLRSCFLLTFPRTGWGSRNRNSIGQKWPKVMRFVQNFATLAPHLKNLVILKGFS